MYLKTVLKDVAKQLRPNTVRAKFGVDKVKNAVHATDLPEDAILEVCIIFTHLFSLYS